MWVSFLTHIYKTFFQFRVTTDIYVLIPEEKMLEDVL